MRNRSIDISKLNRSLYYLNEVAQKYGMNEILEYDDDEPEGVLETGFVVMARNMESLGLDYLLEWKSWWKVWKHGRRDLSAEQLSVVIYNSLADFKQNYLDYKTPENESDEMKLKRIRESLENDRRFICKLTKGTNHIPDAFDYGLRPDELVSKSDITCFQMEKTLFEEIGVTTIMTTEDVDGILWRMAIMNVEMSRGYRNAMVEMTDNNELIDYIDYKFHQYNHHVASQKTIWKNKMVKKSENMAKTCIEMEKRLNKRKQFIREQTVAIQKLKEKNLRLNMLLKYFRDDHKREIQTLNYFILNLKNPSTHLCKAFDFNNEEDMKLYIRWFVRAGRYIKTSRARRIAMLYISEEDKRQQFINMVEAANVLISKSHL